MSVPNEAIGGVETGDTSELLVNSGGTVISTTTAGTWSKYAYQTSVTGTATANGYLSGRSADGTAASGAFSAATAYLRVKLYITTLPASVNEEFLGVLTTGLSFKVKFRLNTSGNILAYDIAGTPNLLATGTAVLTTNKWYVLRFKVGTGSPAALEWYVDGVQDVSTTATLSNTTTNNGAFSFGKSANVNSNTVSFIYDDWHFTDAGYPNDLGRCSCSLPTANGSNTTWTIGAGSGSNYQNVNERPPDSNTTYLVSPATANNLETELLTTTGTLGLSYATINVVTACAIVTRDGGSNTNGQLVIKSGATTTNSTTASVTSTYKMIALPYLTDPNTGSAWVATNVDAIETGYQNTNASNAVRMTWTGAMIDWTPNYAGLIGEGYFVRQAVKNASSF